MFDILGRFLYFFYGGNKNLYMARLGADDLALTISVHLHTENNIIIINSLIKHSWQKATMSKWKEANKYP